VTRNEHTKSDNINSGPIAALGMAVIVNPSFLDEPVRNEEKRMELVEGLACLLVSLHLQDCERLNLWSCAFGKL